MPYRSQKMNWRLELHFVFRVTKQRHNVKLNIVNTLEGSKSCFNFRPSTMLMRLCDYLAGNMLKKLLQEVTFFNSCMSKSCRSPANLWQNDKLNMYSNNTNKVNFYGDYCKIKNYPSIVFHRVKCWIATWTLDATVFRNFTLFTIEVCSNRFIRVYTVGVHQKKR